MNALKIFQPVYVGLCSAKQGLPVSHESVLLSQGSSTPARLRKELYCMTGVAPGFHRRVAVKNAQILHAHFAVDATHALPLIRHLRIPAVVTLHGYDVTIRDEARRSTRSGARYLKHRAELWRKASIFLCVSEFIRDAALKSGFPEEKLVVHHIGIDRSSFYPQPQRREPVVLFVGRLTEKKGCDQLLRAMKVVQQQMPGAELVIIGFGHLRAALEEQAKNLGVRCNFLGAQPATEVRNWMRKARVLCVPSITAANGDSEGLPTVIVEAHAVGLPVVAYRHAGIPEIVKEEETGLLSNEGDIESLTHGLLRYLRDDSFWQTSSEAAVSTVQRSFDLVTQTRKLEAIYDEVCSAVH